MATAEALIAHVDCVVGVSGALHDQAARAFAIGFYGALGDHESVAAAYQHGNAALRLEGLSEAERPQLKVRHGRDAATLIPAAAPPEVRLAPPCPYPGMRPYTADDADHFHGRGAEIDELIGRLRAGERELCVLGPSGSGKSSLVAAGVLSRPHGATASRKLDLIDVSFDDKEPRHKSSSCPVLDFKMVNRSISAIFVKRVDKYQRITSCLESTSVSLFYEGTWHAGLLGFLRSHNPRPRSTVRLESAGITCTKTGRSGKIPDRSPSTGRSGRRGGKIPERSSSTSIWGRGDLDDRQGCARF
ncbi:MAG TPA: hypothetical protein VF469_37460 [Kofleriaceae bacterium]